MLRPDALTQLLPARWQNRLDSYLEALSVFSHIRDRKVLGSLGPAGLRGLVFKRGKQGLPTSMPAHHAALFDWRYPHDQPEMHELYRRAKAGQWDGETYLPWQTSVDPLNPEVLLLPEGFVDFRGGERMGLRLTPKQHLEFRYSLTAWMLSQFLHGEQGALYAAAQVTEAVPFFDGKYYGATQVVDEARHVEVFQRYLERKLQKLYPINDNLFVIIDALMSDKRWDMKFLGMQIMVEGLALGAFGTLYQQTQEPLLRALLRMVIQDEARHVHYGVLALSTYVQKELTETERREREDWAFEIALLMRNRFFAYEVYEEWFEGQISRAQWRELMYHARGMEAFRHTMFRRLVPNLREIGLLSARIQPRYAQEGLMKYFHEASASQLSGPQMIADLDAEPRLSS